MYTNKLEGVSCSRFCMSVLTKIFSLGKESISTVTNCFAEHSEKVCKKYYVQHFSERAAARILWDCSERYKPRPDVKKTAKVRNAAIKRSRILLVRSIKKWIHVIVHRIKLFFNVTVQDDNLIKKLDKLNLEQGISLKCIKLKLFLGVVAKINGSLILILDFTCNLTRLCKQHYVEQEIVNWVHE